MNKYFKVKEAWKMKNGKEVTVTGTLQLQEDCFGDGNNFTRRICRKSIEIYAQGKGSQGEVVRKLTVAEAEGLPAGYTGYNWRVGSLALTDEQADIIQSVKDRIEAHPQWQAKMAAEKRNDEMEKLDYEQKKASGFCFKCGSYCHGDCEAN